jgi:hypothetical protein
MEGTWRNRSPKAKDLTDGCNETLGCDDHGAGTSMDDLLSIRVSSAPMPKGSAAIGNVLSREKTGVDSVPCKRFTIFIGVWFAIDALPNWMSNPSSAALDAVGAAIAEPIAARPVAFRKLRRLPM